MYWMTRYFETVWAITVESAPWVVFSLAVGGLVREFLPASRLQGLMNGGGLIALAGAVVVGALLPICSCGVVPLAISFYSAGVRIGPVMAFTAATPMINPAAVILAVGLLGPQLAAAYVALGLMLALRDRTGRRALGGPAEITLATGGARRVYRAAGAPGSGTRAPAAGSALGIRGSGSVGRVLPRRRRAAGRLDHDSHPDRMG